MASWSNLDLPWECIKFKDMMEMAKPTNKARFGVFECEQCFATRLPFERIYDGEAMIAFKAQGQDIEAIHCGPVRLRVPKRHFSNPRNGSMVSTLPNLTNLDFRKSGDIPIPLILGMRIVMQDLAT